MTSAPRFAETLDPSAFTGEPARRHFVGRCFCFWQDEERAFGTIVWGRPMEPDIAVMTRLFEVGGDPRFAGHASIVDVRGLEAVDVLAFDALLGYLVSRAPAWASNVRRQALVHAGGFAGAVVAGALGVARFSHPVAAFENDDAAAFSWCALSALAPEVRALRASILETPEIVRRVRAVLRARGQALGVDALAEALGISARSLQRRLEEAGTSLRAERKRHLAREIERLLEGTDLDLTAIAAQVGLRSASHLVTSFQQSHGMTPTAWRAARRFDSTRGRGA